MAALATKATMPTMPTMLTWSHKRLQKSRSLAALPFAALPFAALPFAALPFRGAPNTRVRLGAKKPFFPHPPQRMYGHSAPPSVSFPNVKFGKVTLRQSDIIMRQPSGMVVRHKWHGDTSPWWHSDASPTCLSLGNLGTSAAEPVFKARNRHPHSHTTHKHHNHPQAAATVWLSKLADSQPALVVNATTSL
jgi:hypothetical protein